MITLTMLSFTVTYLLYWRFDQMPTHVTIENQFEPIVNLPYPTITLCPSSQMTKSSVEFFNREGNLTIDLKSILPTLLGFYELVDNINDYDLDKLQKSFDLNRFTIPEVMGRIPLSCERFLKHCFLEGELHDCKKIFKPILTVHGYCCSFNSKYYFTGKRVTIERNFKIRTISATGLSSFFSVISDYEPEEAFASTILNAGSIRVMLTDWTEYPFDYESYLVDTNAESYLFLRATDTYCSSDVQLLPVSSRECLFDDERKLPFFWYYHDSDCELMCQVLAVKDSCDCWLFFLPFLGIDNTCKATHIPCIMNVKKNMYLWLNSEQCHCPRNCVSRKYHADVTVGNFRALPYMIDSQNHLLVSNYSYSPNLILEFELRLKTNNVNVITSGCGISRGPRVMKIRESGGRIKKNIRIVYVLKPPEKLLYASYFYIAK
ncbi:unnamed protein product [Arctia plantaginis]|uniref:Sodium channel protein Nach n=1 Tax=Arctia plantaginis TaxID=874455 RepID=A0A8S1AL45_ARCPL|nr:unnamed protein product [Arctia plantaginis]